MRKDEVLDLDSVIDFGKHRGRTVSDVLRDAPTYLAWLRSERGPDSFSDDLNERVDRLIVAGGRAFRRFRTAKAMREAAGKYRGAFTAGPLAARLEDGDEAFQPRIRPEEFYGEAWGAFS